MRKPQSKFWTVWLAVVGIAIAGIFSLSACGIGKAVEPFKDAPVGVQNNGSADGVSMPDGFSNVSTKCDHGNRIYVAYHGDNTYAAIAVVAGDPTCGTGQ